MTWQSNKIQLSDSLSGGVRNFSIRKTLSHEDHEVVLHQKNLMSITDYSQPTLMNLSSRVGGGEQALDS